MPADETKPHERGGGGRPEWAPGPAFKWCGPHLNHKMPSGKTILVISVIAIVATTVWNKFIAPKLAL